jgi:hypothetical protein
MTEWFDRSSPRVALAFDVARLVHDGAVRKGTSVPYIEHPVAVAKTLLDHGYAEDLVVAGLLHDTVEDAKYDNVEFQARLRRLVGEARVPSPADLVACRTAFLRVLEDDFGAHVLELVMGVTETKNNGGPALDWLERKKEQLRHLARASDETAALKAADALHNTECTLRDVRRLGLGVLDRFRGGPLTIWHYSAIAHLVHEKLPGEPLALRLVDAAGQLSEAVSALRPAPPGPHPFPPPSVC